MNDDAKRKDFERYFLKYYQRLSAYVYKKVSDIHIAEDIAMDSFVACWENYDKFDPDKASFQTWLFVVANNRIKNYYRDKKEYVQLNEDVMSDEKNYADDIIQAVALTQMREHLANALEALPELNRKIIIYRYYLKKNSTEISEMTGLTPENIRSRLSRSLDKIKEYFDKNNIRW